MPWSEDGSMSIEEFVESRRDARKGAEVLDQYATHDPDFGSLTWFELRGLEIAKAEALCVECD
jgi:hypothetical protein